MTTSIVHTVVSGPSIERLLDALRLRTKVSFIIPGAPGATTLYVFVNGVEIEDGSGDSWLIKLYDPKELLGSHKLNGYFNTKNRRGHVQPDDESLADD